MEKYRWSKKEIFILFERYPKQGPDIPELQRTKKSIGIKANRLGLKVNPGVRGQKISKALTGSLKGTYRSEETKQKISKTLTGRKVTKETKEKMSKAQTGRKVSEKTKQKISLANFGKKHTQETKEKLRIARLKQKPTFKNTYIEIALQEELNKLGIIYQTHIPVCNICQPDIVFPDKKIAIFCDGDYWHNYPDGREKDRKQDSVLRENGWTVIRFWGSEIRKNPSGCAEKVGNL